MKKVFLAAIAMAVAGCNDFHGQMNVTKGFSAKTTSGWFASSKTLAIAPGNYEATLKGTLGGDVKMVLKLAGKDETFLLKIPSNRLPKEHGGFQIQSEELQQPFAVRGSLDTQYDRGQSYRGVESCTRTHDRSICGRDSSGAYACRTETVTTMGEQNVEYHSLTTTQILGVEVFAPTSPSETLATVQGTNVTTQRIYTYQSACY